jgi:hypothetical protein
LFTNVTKDKEGPMTARKTQPDTHLTNAKGIAVITGAPSMRGDALLGLRKQATKRGGT